MTKFEIVCHESLSSSNSKSPSQGQDEDKKKYQEKEEEEDQEEHHKGRIVLSKQPDSVASSTSSSRKKHRHKVEDEEDEEDNDGFRTPTSLDHRIPAAKKCPPAPRKLPKPYLKRKSSSSSSSSSPSSHSSLFSCRSHPLDLSKEVELLFPATQHNQLLCDSHQSIKKFKRERSPCDV